MFEIYTIDNCPYCMNTLMTLDKYRLPYHQVNVTEEEKEYYKKLNNMPSFPQIFLVMKNKDGNASNQRKTKKGKAKVLTNKNKNANKNTNRRITATSNMKHKIGGDQDFQVLVRLAIELKNKKVDLPIMTEILRILH